MTATKNCAFRSTSPEVAEAWNGLYAGSPKATRMARRMERDFAKEYGIDKSDLVCRTGFGDDVPIGFRWPWNAGEKPKTWVWWDGKRKGVLIPRADKSGDAWRARLAELRRIYPMPRTLLKDRFGVPDWDNGISPGLNLVGDTLWVFFGERGSGWDGGDHFASAPLSAYYAAIEGAA